jgi:hypothetical protein
LDTESVKATLVDHHSSHDYRPEKHYAKVVNDEGMYIGPYIPYIGKSYFTSKPRLLIYAMAQNLARAHSLINRWHTCPDKGMLRHYYQQEPLHIHLYPYDQGHLKVIAALALSAYPNTSFKSSDNVNDFVAVTNFVKFSFYTEAKDERWRDANPPPDIYGTMWRLFCGYEIELLQPDIIIGVGKDVAGALCTGLKEEGKRNIVVKVDFPGKLNLHSRWVPKGKELIRDGQYNPNPFKAELAALIAGTPDNGRHMNKAIETYWYYFLAMKEHLINRIAELACGNSSSCIQ